MYEFNFLLFKEKVLWWAKMKQSCPVILFNSKLLIFICIFIVGCDQHQLNHKDESEFSDSAEKSTYSVVNHLRQTEFLEINQGSVAATWLALKAKPDNLLYLPDETEVAKYETQLLLLTQELLEDRRMAANRTVQIRDALAKDNIYVSILEILEGLNEVAKEKVAGTYSDYCGWYVVLRQNKLDHKTAIEKMKLIHSGQS